MWETFFILVAGGLALPVRSISASRHRLLLLCAVILAIASLAICVFREPPATLTPMLRQVQWALLIGTTAAIFVQLATIPRFQKVSGVTAFVMAILAGS